MKLRLLIVSFCLIVHGTCATSLGEKVAAWTPGSRVNPDELGSDIRGEKLYSDEYGTVAAVVPWPGNTIPYVFDGNFSTTDRELIKTAMEEFENVTCIRFKPRTEEPIHITITSQSDGCFCSVGYRGMGYKLNLQNPGCVYKGVILHELMHAVGFDHEHNRKDRDNYVKINWENIEKNDTFNFEKNSYDLYDEPYNYDSIVHYSAYAFSKNGEPTVEVINHENVTSFGQRDKLSQGDINNINQLYKCFQKPKLHGTTTAAPIEVNKGLVPSIAQQIKVNGITYNREDCYIMMLSNGAEIWMPKNPRITPAPPTNEVLNPFSRLTNTGFDTFSPGYTFMTQDPYTGYYRQYYYGRGNPNFGYYPSYNFVPIYPNYGYNPGLSFTIEDISDRVTEYADESNSAGNEAKKTTGKLLSKTVA